MCSEIQNQNHKKGSKKTRAGWGWGLGGGSGVSEGCQGLRMALTLFWGLQEQSCQAGGAQCQGCPSPSSSLNKDDN